VASWRGSQVLDHYPDLEPAYLSHFLSFDECPSTGKTKKIDPRQVLREDFNLLLRAVVVQAAFDAQRANGLSLPLIFLPHLLQIKDVHLL
jgi:hypothetical protein